MTRPVNKFPPFQPHSATSLAAAIAIYPKVGTLRRRVFDFIRKRREFGAADFEIEFYLGIPGSTVRPRRGELAAAGLIVKTETRRRTASGCAAVVWVAERESNPGEQVELL